MLDEVERAMLAHDPAALAIAAHSLKGALKALSAEPAATRAAELEQIGRGATCGAPKTRGERWWTIWMP
jgi:HPt (histidine-containing phosphotransfer) domain-containing protein